MLDIKSEYYYFLVLKGTNGRNDAKWAEKSHIHCGLQSEKRIERQYYLWKEMVILKIVIIAIIILVIMIKIILVTTTIAIQK